MADFTASRSSGFTYFAASVSRTNSRPSRITSSSVEAQYFPRRNSMTKAGTLYALRILRSRSLRTTRPGKASADRRSSSSSSSVGSFIRPSHVSPHGEFDPTGRELLRGLHVPDVQFEDLPLPEGGGGVEEESR